MIEIRHLKKVYPDITPLKDVNATIRDGEIVSVIGPSGTGKSTLIRCINRLETPTAGQILIDGVDITAKGCRIHEVRRKMGMVFQSFNLFGHLTVVENVMKPAIELAGMSRQEAYDKAMELLHRVGLDGRALRYPDMLSGGQKQRVAIARTLSMDPEIILFDEPTSALDPTMVGEVQAVIRDLAATGKTMMIVTHEMKFAREICSRVFYMDEGGIYEDGTPEEIFDHPKKENTRRFVFRLKVFETQIEGRAYDFIGAMSDIEQYAYKNRIPPKTVYRLQSLFEELCQTVLTARLTDPRISFVAEYDEQDGKVNVTVRYNGELFDPRDTDNALALRMIENLSESFVHTGISAAPYTNEVRILLKA